MALTGLEVLQVLGKDGAGMPAAITQTVTTGQIAALGAAESSPIVQTSITTAGAGVLTAAGIVGQLISRSGPVAAFTDTTDTAVAIVAALPLYVAGESFVLRIKNLTAFPQTLAAGAGVTLSGALIIPANSVGSYLVTIVSATAVTILHLTTAALSNLPVVQFAAATNTTGFTATGAQVGGAADVVLNLSGAMSGDANIQSPAATDLVAAIPNARAGNNYKLRIINSSSVNHVWTLTTNTGNTLTDTMTIAQNTWRDFIVTLTSLTAVVYQSAGTGTNS